MAREHAAMATSPNCRAQMSASSAAATAGEPATATTVSHGNSQYADERIRIACDLRNEREETGQPFRRSPWALIPPLVGRGTTRMVHRRGKAAGPPACAVTR